MASLADPQARQFAKQSAPLGKGLLRAEQGHGLLHAGAEIRGGHAEPFVEGNPAGLAFRTPVVRAPETHFSHQADHPALAVADVFLPAATGAWQHAALIAVAQGLQGGLQDRGPDPVDAIAHGLLHLRPRRRIRLDPPRRLAQDPFGLLSGRLAHLPHQRFHLRPGSRTFHPFPPARRALWRWANRRSIRAFVWDICCSSPSKRRHSATHWRAWAMRDLGR